MIPGVGEVQRNGRWQCHEKDLRSRRSGEHVSDAEDPDGMVLQEANCIVHTKREPNTHNGQPIEER